MQISIDVRMYGFVVVARSLVNASLLLRKLAPGWWSQVDVTHTSRADVAWHPDGSLLMAPGTSHGASSQCIYLACPSACAHVEYKSEWTILHMDSACQPDVLRWCFGWLLVHLKAHVDASM